MDLEHWICLSNLPRGIINSVLVLWATQAPSYILQMQNVVLACSVKKSLLFRWSKCTQPFWHPHSSCRIAHVFVSCQTVTSDNGEAYQLNFIIYSENLISLFCTDNAKRMFENMILYVAVLTGKIRYAFPHIYTHEHTLPHRFLTRRGKFIEDN